MKLFPNWSVDREIAEPFSSQSTVCCNMKLEMYSRLSALYSSFFILFSVLCTRYFVLCILYFHVNSDCLVSPVFPPSMWWWPTSRPRRYISHLCHMSHPPLQYLSHPLSHSASGQALQSQVGFGVFQSEALFYNHDMTFSKLRKYEIWSRWTFLLYERIYHLPGVFFYIPRVLHIITL